MRLSVEREREKYKEAAFSAKQLPLDEWPVGVRDVAFTLNRTPAEIAKLLDIHFETDHDNLDEFDAAVVSFPAVSQSGRPRQVVFQAYRNGPDKSLHVIPDMPNDHMIHLLVQLLGIREKEVGWAEPLIWHQLRREWKTMKARGPIARRFSQLRSRFGHAPFRQPAVK